MKQEEFEAIVEAVKETPEIKALDKEIEDLKVIDKVFKGELKITSINQK